eukprot:1176885-Prorocentrum_minimum.AAC.2
MSTLLAGAPRRRGRLLFLKCSPKPAPGSYPPPSQPQFELGLRNNRRFDRLHRRIVFLSMFLTLTTMFPVHTATLFGSLGGVQGLEMTTTSLASREEIEVRTPLSMCIIAIVAHPPRVVQN